MHRNHCPESVRIRKKIEVIEEVTIKPFTSYLRPFLLDSILHDHYQLNQDEYLEKDNYRK
jgi:hypothetical protein